MSEALETLHCPTCGSGPDEHIVERDGPESIDMVVCQRCGARWLPRPVAGKNRIDGDER